MELKSGYTKEELSRFMQQAFREKQRIRRTPSGGWETFTPPHEPPQPQLQPPSPTSQPSQLSQPSPSDADADPQPSPPQGFWQRLRHRFRKRDNPQS